MARISDPTHSDTQFLSQLSYHSDDEKDFTDLLKQDEKDQTQTNTHETLRKELVHKSHLIRELQTTQTLLEQ